MRRVYLIRHGLPDFPGGEKKCIGTTDLPLSDAGHAQAAEMARLLPAVTAVFSSPLSRAVQTARAIGMPVTVLPGLRELHAGEWDGLPFSRIRELYPDLYAARATDRTLPLPGGEDREHGLARFSAAMEEAAALAPGDFAVVAHGGVIAEFLQSISGRRLKPGYCQIVPLALEHGIFISGGMPHA